MKVKDLFEGHLGYRAKMGNIKKTITEVGRFLSYPIYQAVGEKEIRDLKEVDIADIVEKSKRYGIHGPQRAVMYFIQLMRYAKKTGIKVPIDLDDVKIPKVPQGRVEYLERDEIEKVRNAIDTSTPHGLRTRALIEFLLDTGLRIKEACSLNISDIDFEKRRFDVINCKTGERNTVNITDLSIPWLKHYLSFREDDCPALFMSGRGRLLPVTSRNYMRKITKELNINKRVAHHIWRRTLCTGLAHNGADINSNKTIMRHKSERTTLRYYAGTNDQRCREIHQQIISKVFMPAT